MTQIDIAALVAELRADAKLHEDLLPDRAADALIAQDAELKRLPAVEAQMHGIANELSWSKKTREISDRIRAALGEKP